jgi:primosomal protein N' (replication factor Y)
MANCDDLDNIIFQVAIAVPFDCLFDYLAPDDYHPASTEPGVRVRVPFGKTSKIGFVLAIRNTSEIDFERLKKIEEILDPEPLLTSKDIKLLQWVSRYYHHPLGEVLATAFPNVLRKGKPAKIKQDGCYVLSSLGQQTVPEQLHRSPRQQALLALFHAQNGLIANDQLLEYRQVLKTLEKKNLIVKSEQPVPFGKTSLNSPLPANFDQLSAINTIVSGLGRFSVFLLEGVTGSGKTEVYMQSIWKALEQGLQVLVLLPEITLTPQLEQRFRLRFTVPIVSYHSKLTDVQRLNAWLSMKHGSASIMLGTRSALFTPFKSPGLIILDEEHDISFKQQEGFRFSARDVAIARAKSLEIPVILGSATPSLESLYNVERNRYSLLHLPKRAGNAIEPAYQLVDIRNKRLQSGMSEMLIAAIKTTLEQGQQVLLFLNRRGFAPVQICHSCGWVSRCRHCDANLVIHAADKILRCHHCGSEQKLADICPNCKSGALMPLGMGTERIEQEISSLFPDKRIVRLDKDTTQRKGSLENYLQLINQGEADIILGTQMLAKGHHFPNVTLVAILDIDSGLYSIDFRASEKLAQVIVQVAGRAGRAELPGKVILQTRHPQHPMLCTLLENGYRRLAQDILQERHKAKLPPYSFQAIFRAHAAKTEKPQEFLNALSELIKKVNSGKTSVLGPVSAPMAKRSGQFRFQLLLQSTVRQDLHSLLDIVLPEIVRLKEAKKVRWSLDIDPVDLY